jgi:hypothetical protein
MKSPGSAANNNDSLLVLMGDLGLVGACFGHDTPNLALDFLFAGADNDLAILHFCVILPQRVESWCVFDVTRADVEAGYDVGMVTFPVYVTYRRAMGKLLDHRWR